jgi:hypothetical protein
MSELPGHAEYLAFMRRLHPLPPQLRWEITCDVRQEGSVYKIKWTAQAKPIGAFEYDERSDHEQDDATEPPEDASAVEPTLPRHDD